MIGGLNFFTSAGSRAPLESMTVSDGCGVNSIRAIARSVAATPDPVLDVGVLAAHEAPGLQRRVDAGLIDGLLLELVRDPGGQAIHGVDHVGVRDQPATPVDEPAGAGLDERRGLDDDRPLPAIERDLGVDPGRDERDGGPGAKARLLDAERFAGAGKEQPRDDDRGQHPACHAPHPTMMSHRFARALSAARVGVVRSYRAFGAPDGSWPGARK